MLSFTVAADINSVRKPSASAAGELLLTHTYAQAMQAGILNADGSLSDTGSTLPTG